MSTRQPSLSSHGALIALQEARKCYNLGQPSEVEVLHGVNLQVVPGEFVALIGPSGSGKSTLLNVLGLLEPLSSGRYLLQGEAVQDLDDMALTLLRRRTLGFVFQFHHLLPAFSALENVTLPALMSEGRVSSGQRERARSLLEAVGLARAMEKRPNELSGGMQQRVAIARAIVMNPKYLFCDEPNSGLDPKTSLVIDELLSGITKDYNMTTIINTHDMNSVMGIGENICFICKGHKEWQGHKDQVMSSTNEQLNDLVFASDLFRKVKEVEMKGKK